MKNYTWNSACSKVLKHSKHEAIINRKGELTGYLIQNGSVGIKVLGAIDFVNKITKGFFKIIERISNEV